MLFVKPEFFKIGVGKALLLFAVKNYDAIWVDVNEQNVKALEFYKHMGFTVFSYSKANNTTNSFRIVHMKWKEEI